METVGKEMCKKWRLSGDLGLANLGEEKFLLEFHSKEEAIRVLKSSTKHFNMFNLMLEPWIRKEGCAKEIGSLREL